MYLIAVLAPWLLLTASFAALAGWAVAAERGAPALAAQRRERDKLVRDLAKLAAGEATPQTAIVSDAETARSLASVRDGRIAELERALEQSRARAAELAGEVAEHQRRAERYGADAAELARLREQAAAHEAQAAQTIDAHVEPLAAPVPVEPPEEEVSALQTWRLRYFEQRVKFLESRTASPSSAAAPEPEAAAEWRARDAEARARFLEQELRRREQSDAAPAAGSPFAANADVDALLRWRMLYLERRTAHLQDAAARLTARPAPAEEAAPDIDRWRWRARYLESRVRHLEQRTPLTKEAAHVDGAEPEAHAEPPTPSAPEERPPSLPAANAGAPDDFTLIDGVSPLQQSTLNSLGIYHFEQIAAWTPGNVAWVDRYLRLRGRIGEEEWVEQADKLAREGVNGTTYDAALPRL
ncbi:MAG: hypothetical protein JSS00_10610 [Proteobacteria bacterium]|nr:hypothetical protein [Pseudomonadota bacterium]